MDNRQIDTLVAQYVMGLPDKDINRRTMVRSDLPHYTTDIAAAWQVVEKLKKHGFYAVIWVKPGIVQLYCHNEVCTIEEKGTVPLAICLAALKAVGVEIDELA